MKKLILLFVLVALTMSACTQTSNDPYPFVEDGTVSLFFIDTISDSNGITYLNTFDGIWIYHESDWLLYESDADENGDWFVVYYDDNSGTVYEYFLTEELCYKLITYNSPQTIAMAEYWLRMKGVY